MLASAFLSLLAASAQEIAPSASDLRPESDEIIELSPFRVTSSNDKGYLAQSTLSGTRLKTNLKDIASPTSAFTSQFFSDAAITNVSDLTSFMLSTETDFGEDTSGQARLNSDARQVRMRGLPGGSQAVNFFNLGSDTRLDTFSLDRADQSRGPNSVLFGIGTPGGLVNVTTKRALLGRYSGAVAMQGQSEGGFRTELDYNQPILKNRLGVRVAAVKEESGSWRNYEYGDAERFFATAKWKIAATTEIEGEVETGHSDRAPKRTFTALDAYTQWRAAGQKLGTAANTAVALRLLAANTARATYDEATGKIYNWAGTTATIPLTIAGVSGVPISNFSLLPPETVIYGPGYFQSADYTRMMGFLRHSFSRDFNAEAAVYRNVTTRTGVDADQANSIFLAADTNAKLPGGAANPNAGRPFFESVPVTTIDDTVADNARVTVSYERDFGRILGHHTIAGVAQYNHSKSNRGQWAERIVTNPYNTSAPENAANSIWRRTYVGQQLPDGTWTLDGIASNELVMQDWRLTDPNNLAVTGTTAGLSRSAVGTAIIPVNFNGNWIRSTQGSTTIAMLQSRFWKDRINTVVGVSRDRQKAYESTIGATVNRTPLPGFTQGLISPVPATEADVFTANNVSFSGVVQVLPAVGLTYSQAQNAAVPNSANRLLGGRAPAPKGKSRDFGVKLDLFDGRVFLTALYFQTAASPDTDFTPGVGPTQINRIWTALDAAGVLAANGLTLAGVSDNTNVNTFDSETEGFEAEVTANLRPNWRAYLNYTNSQTKRKNIGREMQAYLASKREFWLANGTVPLVDTAGTVATQAALIDTLAFDTFVVQDGREPLGQMRHKLNLRTNYDFGGRRLKGVSVGGALRYQSGAIVAYTAAADGAGKVNADARLGADQTFVDFNLGYRRPLKISGHSLVWSIQLNVNNVFDNNDLVVLRTSSVGDLLMYRFNPPRQWIVSSRIMF